jgi:hypothetical protein
MFPGGASCKITVEAPRSAIGKAGMMALLMAVTALWTSGAYAGLNENLFEAAYRGDLPEVKPLLAKGAEVNAKNKHGRTALMLASMRGHREIQEMLIKAGFSKSMPGRWYCF